MPLWLQSFRIEPRSIIDMKGPGFSAPMQTAYWGTDNCLYGNPNQYPIIAPPVFYKPNKEYVSMWKTTSSDAIHFADIMGFLEMGCATKPYSGPAVENPWNMRNFGTTVIPDTSEPSPDTGEPSGSGDDLLDQLRFYRDYQPLYRVLHDAKTKSEDEQKKSDAETSPFDLTANADTSLFDTDWANQVDYSAFLPSSDDSTNSDISWNVNTDPGSNYLANLDLGTDLGIDIFANTDTGTNPDNTYNFGSGLFAGSISISDSSSDAGSDSGSNDYDFFNTDGLFSKKRTRRSARDFLRPEKVWRSASSFASSLETRHFLFWLAPSLPLWERRRRLSPWSQVARSKLNEHWL